MPPVLTQQNFCYSFSPTSSRLLPASLSLKPRPASSFSCAFLFAVDGSCSRFCLLAVDGSRARFCLLGYFAVIPLHLLPPVQPLFSCFLFLTRSLKPPMAEAQNTLES